jgi:Tol biopolymer transport system component
MWATFGVILGISMCICLNYQGRREPNTQPAQPTVRTAISDKETDIYTIGDITDHIWSPDGTKMAYIKTPLHQGWNCELWVADKCPSNATLENHTLISSEAEYNRLLDWKGDWILFKIRREEGTPSAYYGRNELWKIRYNGTGLTQVTFTETNGIRDTWGTGYWINVGTVTWDGRFIPGTSLVYFVAHDGNGWYKTYVCNGDGTDSWYDISSPDYAWTWGVSPTGNKLVWGQMSNYYMPTTFKTSNVDGTNKKTIKTCSGVASPLILADGNTIIWQENDNTIMAVNMDNTVERTVAADEYLNAWYNYHPRELGAFLMGSNRVDGNMHVFRLNVNGSYCAQLTTGPYRDEMPIVSPDGKYLSYLRLPANYDKLSNTQPYPYELVVRNYAETPVSFTPPSDNIPGYSAYLVVGIASVVSGILVRKRLNKIRAI